jgi:hypothetical protein
MQEKNKKKQSQFEPEETQFVQKTRVAVLPKRPKDSTVSRTLVCLLKESF